MNTLKKKSTRQNNVQIFSIHCLRQSDKQIYIIYIKYEMWKALGSMSLLKKVGKKLPPLQRSSLEKESELFTYNLQPGGP